MMIQWNDFESAVISQLNRDISTGHDPNQHNSIIAPATESLFLAAGPGSGKTTVIALRVLKLIFVDDADPSNILLTTFTRRAAAQLRSRVLGWGDILRQFFLSLPTYTAFTQRLQQINFNNIITGTLDSIAEDMLSDPGSRLPGIPAPAVIESFISDALMIRVGLFDQGRHLNQNLENYIGQLRGSNFGIGISEKKDTLIAIKDRFFHDQINQTLYRTNATHPGVAILCDAVDNYILELQNRLLYDFTGLEQFFLVSLQNNTLPRINTLIKFVLIDEYQDTNLLQEQIYFELSRLAIHNGGSVAVVGDDDQSLYRFRGATVDLFTGFPTRAVNQLNINPSIIYLSQNYRSTNSIVSFCNGFIILDNGFQSARFQNKPPIIPRRQPPYTDFPILGMFRDDVITLASDLCNFIHYIVHGTGYPVTNPQNHNIELIKIDPHGGSAGDIALLCSSPKEYDYKGDPRLPLLLRTGVGSLNPPINIFNPRGQSLQSSPDVQRLCGLILECIDPRINGRLSVQDSINNLPQLAVAMLNEWRVEAVRTVNSSNNTLMSNFVNAWQNRTPLGPRTWQQREISLIDLAYKLVTWLPNMQNDVEGLVYLEAITRTIKQTSSFSAFEGSVIIDTNSNLERASIKEAIWNIFVPIASGAIEINEDLLATLPSDRINVMSIHQAKGLEFPLVIVDVGSDFKTLQSGTFKRFPRLNPNGRVTFTGSVNMEDEFRVYSSLGTSTRPALDRAFDDLIRHYFVAFSRAQDVLLLVGLNSVCSGYNVQSGHRDIPNIATGWDRNMHWHWGNGLHNLVHI